jgi:hypothetical protein
MLEFCMRGEKKSKLFACLFLQLLPRELPLHLTPEGLSDLKSLVTKAD